MPLVLSSQLIQILIVDTVLNDKIFCATLIFLLFVLQEAFENLSTYKNKAHALFVVTKISLTAQATTRCHDGDNEQTLHAKISMLTVLS